MEIDLSRVAVSLEALELVPGSLARRFGVLPLTVVEGILYLAMDNPEDGATIDQLEDLTGYEITAYPVSGDSDLFETIGDYYPLGESSSGSEEGSAERTLNELLSRALKMRASDLHIFPEERTANLYFRIDSTLTRAKEMSRQSAAELISFVKVRAGMNIAEKKVPLDGSLMVPLRKGKINLRIATIPTVHGEHMTLRILSDEVFADLSSLPALGFDPRQLGQVRGAMKKTQGLIYLSGPTGSGKTTTMYSMLKELVQVGGKHIISVEDPVESIIPGLTQIPVNTGEDPMKFHKILRSVLRHDPDVILIGETRDAESAQVAIQAAMTGHLVFSTVHANDSVAVIERLLELGIERSPLASSMILSLAQRLLRRPCLYCVRCAVATPGQVQELGVSINGSLQATTAVGCPLCRGKGSAGRIGLFELLEIADEQAEVIADSSCTTHERKERLRPDRTLLEDGIVKMNARLVLYDELITLK